MTITTPPSKEEEAESESALRTARDGALTKAEEVKKLALRVTSRPPPPHRE